MHITEIWKQEGIKILNEKMIPTIGFFGREIYITIYLLQWDDDDSYFIKGENGYEYAALHMSIFTKEKAKEIFESL